MEGRGESSAVRACCAFWNREGTTHVDARDARDELRHNCATSAGGLTKYGRGARWEARAEQRPKLLPHVGHVPVGSQLGMRRGWKQKGRGGGCGGSTACSQRDEQVVHERHRCARGQRHAVWSSARVRADAQNGGHPTSLAARLHSPDGEGQSAAAHLMARFCVWSSGYKLSLLSKQEPLCERPTYFLKRRRGAKSAGGCYMKPSRRHADIAQPHCPAQPVHPT